MALYIDEMATYAQSGGLGTVGTNLFRGALDDAGPDKQCALIPYGGMKGEAAFGDDVIKWEFPRFQFLSRGDKGDPRPALQKCEDAYRWFGRICAETIAGTFYHGSEVTPPQSLGLDDNGRPLFACNVALEKERSA